MTTELLAQTLQPGAPGYFGQGRYWLIKTATGPLTVRAEKSGVGSTNIRNFVNMPAGARFKAEIGDGWDRLIVTSATAQNVELIVGDDEVEISSAVTVNGSVTTTEAAAAAWTASADQVIAAGGNYVIPANLSRKAVIVGSLTSNNPLTTNLRASSAASATGAEIQPGMNQRIPVTGTVTVFNGDANPQTIYIAQEV